MTNRQIGVMFGGLSYSAVSKANERFSSEAKKSRTLKRTLNKISDKMSYVNGLTPLSLSLTQRSAEMGNYETYGN